MASDVIMTSQLRYMTSHNKISDSMGHFTSILIYFMPESELLTSL